MKKIGFTGTKQGMTKYQKTAVTSLLKRLKPDVVYHGGCIGADMEFDDICYHLIFPSHSIIRDIHPANISAKRGEWHYTPYVADKKDPLMRNRDIVNLSQLIIATPKEEYEVLRSGTWSTIRYAKKEGKIVYIVYPDGMITDGVIINE